MLTEHMLTEKTSEGHVNNEDIAGKDYMLTLTVTYRRKKNRELTSLK